MLIEWMDEREQAQNLDANAQPDEETRKTQELIRRVMEQVLADEGVQMETVVGVTLVDPDRIREINNAFRQVDRVTDVLSFPMIGGMLKDATPAELLGCVDPETGALELGDLVICVDRAKEQVSTEDARFEDVLAELERERRRIEKMKEEAQRMRSAAQSERDKMRAERDAAEERADKMMEGARSQADNILKNARMTAETVFDELETLKKQSQKKASEQNLAAAKAALRGVITQTENEQRRGIQKRVVDAEEVRPLAKGDRVRLLNVGGVIAIVLAAPDRDGSVQVQAGPMKMTVKVNEVRLVEEKKAAPKPKMQPRRDAPRRELNLRSAESEVDVRGMSAEEALFEVDNFLSRAIMAGLPAVTVIHGKGTGVLRNAVQQHLRKNKRVKSVRSGVYGEGEQGVTIVELK